MRTLYLFDFDGTLSFKDSTRSFYKKVTNPLTFILSYYIIPLPQILKYFLFNRGGFSIKLIRLRNVFRFTSKKKLKSFILDSDKHIDEILKPGAVNFIRQLLLDNNNDVFIVSASLSFLLKKWSDREHIGLISNAVEFSSNYDNVKFVERFDCDGIGKSLFIKRDIDLSKYSKIISYGDTNNDFFMFLLSDIYNYKPTFVDYEI